MVLYHLRTEGRPVTRKFNDDKGMDLSAPIPGTFSGEREGLQNELITTANNFISHTYYIIEASFKPLNCQGSESFPVGERSKRL